MLMLMLMLPYSSLALISARATITAIEVLTMIVASYLHALCQALDLRAMQDELKDSINVIVREEVRQHFGRFFPEDSQESSAKIEKLCRQTCAAIHESIENTSTMDNKPRMEKAARSTTSTIVEFFLPSTGTETESNIAALEVLPVFRAAVATGMANKQHELRKKFLTGAAGPTPASRLLGRTKILYEFIRAELGIRMHGRENLEGFEGGIGKEERTVGGDISVIYEVCLDVYVCEAFVLTSHSGHPKWTHAGCPGKALRRRGLGEVMNGRSRRYIITTDRAEATLN